MEGGRSAYRTERAVNDPTSVGMVPESPTPRLYRYLHHPQTRLAVTRASQAPRLPLLAHACLGEEERAAYSCPQLAGMARQAR